MDRFNGGTPMLYIRVSSFEENVEFWTCTHDVDGAQEIMLFDPSSITSDTGVVIELILIDWSSTLELQFIMVENVGLLLS